MARTHDGLRGHERMVDKAESHKHRRNYEVDEVAALRAKLLQSAPSVAEIFEQLDRDKGVGRLPSCGAFVVVFVLLPMPPTRESCTSVFSGVVDLICPEPLFRH